MLSDVVWLILVRCVFTALARVQIRTDPRMQRKTVAQRDAFIEDVWYLVYYVGIVALWCAHMPWEWFTPAGGATQWATAVAPESIDGWVRWLVGVELAFYASELLFLALVNRHKSDYWMQWIHHGVTLWLAGMARSMGYWHITAVILFMHDVVDVPMFAAKYTKHLGVTDSLVTVFFIFFALLFFATRWVVLPFWIIGPMVRTDAYASGEGIFPYLVWSLCVIQCLHLIWGTMILNIVRRKLFGGRPIEDIRDKKE